MIYALIA